MSLFSVLKEKFALNYTIVCMFMKFLSHCQALSTYETFQQSSQKKVKREVNKKAPQAASDGWIWVCFVESLYTWHGQSFNGDIEGGSGMGPFIPMRLITVMMKSQIV